MIARMVLMMLMMVTKVTKRNGKSWVRRVREAPEKILNLVQSDDTDDDDDHVDDVDDGYTDHMKIDKAIENFTFSLEIPKDTHKSYSQALLSRKSIEIHGKR